MPVTHQQIADKMGISRALVTKALHRSNGTRVSEDTRREVIRVAEEMGYQPRNVTTHNIGYVFSVDALMLETGVSFLMNVQRALSEQGLSLTLADVQSPPATLRQMLSPKFVDGVIATQWFGGKVCDILTPDIPWVLTSDEDGVSDNIDVVALDAVQSARNVFEYLVALGHHKFCLIIGARNIKFHRQIKAGAEAVLLELGQSASALQVLKVSNNKEIAVPLQRLMAQPNHPTTIVTTNPGQTLPALHALLASGFHVPQDISLMSIGDSLQFEALTPAVTATTAGGAELAALAVTRLAQKIRDPLSPPQRELCPGAVIERESVSAPPG